MLIGSGQEAVVGVPGPMGTCVDDLVLILRSLMTPAVWQRDHGLRFVASLCCSCVLTPSVLEPFRSGSFTV
jgi:hypothetical protein